MRSAAKGYAMSRLERQACTAKAVAEYFALIADARHAPHPLGAMREVDEELWECSTEVGAAMEKFCACIRSTLGVSARDWKAFDPSVFSQSR
jgi:hypothetical protein